MYFAQEAVIPIRSMPKESSEMVSQLIFGDFCEQLKEEGKDKEIHHCDVCDINCNGEVCWEAHISGSKHKKVLLI